MKSIIEEVASLVILLAWVVGWVVAKGFWSTLGAITVPPYAWYLVVDWAMRRGGLL